MPKAAFIQKMFDDISFKYDLLNDVLSFGSHRFWKRKFVKQALKLKPQNVLDCATGTGDIAFLLEKAQVKNIQGIDFSSNMISVAKSKALQRKSICNFTVADIQTLPFSDKHFDVATISFGIRNTENLSKALKELNRVSKNLLVLEFGKPESKLFSQFYFFILKIYFPIFAKISGRPDAYDYLITSSKEFPSGATFIQLLRENTNFKKLYCEPLFGGIAYIYIAKSEEL